MNRGGTGSASIVLIFAVLCLVIFTVISLISALNEQTPISMEVALVKAYYEADTLAEQVLAEILSEDSKPAEIVSFMCPISDTMGLYVAVLINGESHEILSWRMENIYEWQPNTRLNVWSGW